MKPTRRDLLQSVGAAGALSISSCLGDGSDGGDGDGPGRTATRADDERRAATRAARTPPVDEIPAGGVGDNFELVGHAPLYDHHQYVGDETDDVPRGSNGDLAVAGDVAYVGSLIGQQPPLIVDIADPSDPEVVGPIPDAIPGVGNGVEGIEVSGDVLVLDHRHPLGEEFDTPAGDPARGLSVYDASDPRSIDRVFTAVISNF